MITQSKLPTREQITEDVLLATSEFFLHKAGLDAVLQYRNEKYTQVLDENEYVYRAREGASARRYPFEAGSRMTNPSHTHHLTETDQTRFFHQLHALYVADGWELEPLEAIDHRAYARYLASERKIIEVGGSLVGLDTSYERLTRMWQAEKQMSKAEYLAQLLASLVSSLCPEVLSTISETVRDFAPRSDK